MNNKNIGMRLQNKNSFITGCNRGLGKAILVKFASEGSDIWAHARKETSGFKEFIKETADKYNVEIRPVYFDILDTASMKEAVKGIMQSKIPVDILINNAGIAHGGLFHTVPVQQIRSVFDINFFAVMELSQLILKLMLRKNSGSIVNITSVSGMDLSAGNCAYGVSKASLIAATRTLAAEYTPHGIRINAVAPGLLETDMAELMEGKAYNDMIERSLMNRLGKPEEVASVVAFLSSDEASFISGQVLRIDGGSK